MPAPLAAMKPFPFDNSPQKRIRWSFFEKPELKIDSKVLIPELGGWRWEGLISASQEEQTKVVPDWVCEVASPVSERVDRMRKMPLYAAAGVTYVWLVRAEIRLVEVFKHDNGWRWLGAYDGERAAIPPFHDIPSQVREVWL